MPFDWTFSLPAMVRDCLDDDFRAFLDPREYIAIGKRGAGAGHTRYSELRLPGRWRGFTFLHHDPLRKRKDFDYFKRCVERFRDAARAPGRKLFVVSCLVDSLRSLHEIKMDRPSLRSETFFDESKGIRGHKASWGYFAPLEVVKLFESLQHFGVSDFKLVALVLCIGDASVAEKEPVILGIPLDLQKAAADASSNCVMFEIHLGESGACGAEADPFKFFEASHDEAFTTAVLGGVPVLTELDPLQNDYKPAGYRDCLVDSATDSGAKDNQHLFACKCCATSFASRNRLYAHIRSSPSCIKFVEETDAEGFQSLLGNGKELVSQVFALMIGIPGIVTRNDLDRNLKTALHCVGVGIENIPHQGTDGHLTSCDQCPAVAFTIFVKMSCSLRGEALLCRLRELLALKMLVLHSCEAVGKSMALQWQQSSLQQHFGYLLPFLALSQPVEDFSQQQDIYRRFKQSSEPCAEDMAKYGNAARG